ncbi:gfo/Idh/MocA family oxidoreductase, partial [Pseudoxanthomonas sp. SGD-10]
GATNTVIAQTEDNWRLNPALSGGGLFHDLAPHQIDLMYYLFGSIKSASGLATNKAKQTAAQDMVAGQILFHNDILFNGLWCFNSAKEENIDLCELIGSKGKISFSFFGPTKIIVAIAGAEEIVNIPHPNHVQQPMIERVVQYFLDRGENPCSGAEGAEVLRVMDTFTK